MFLTRATRNTIFGASMPDKPIPSWDALLSSAAHLQKIVPGAVLVGFDTVLADLESVAGWQTARIRRPVLILGSLDGIETGIRQLIRSEPLETAEIETGGIRLTLPTREEMLRVKSVLILKRNATRDYIDFAAMARNLGNDGTGHALIRFDELYPQPNGASALQQLANQLANPLPFDLDDTNLAEYKHLIKEYQDWNNIRQICSGIAVNVIHPML